jgi:hypothetical protein
MDSRMNERHFEEHGIGVISVLTWQTLSRDAGEAGPLNGTVSIIVVESESSMLSIITPTSLRLPSRVVGGRLIFAVFVSHSVYGS